MDKDFEEFRKQAEAKAMRGLFDEQTQKDLERWAGIQASTIGGQKKVASITRDF